MIKFVLHCVFPDSFAQGFVGGCLLLPKILWWWKDFSPGFERTLEIAFILHLFLERMCAILDGLGCKQYRFIVLEVSEEMERPPEVSVMPTGCWAVKSSEGAASRAAQEGQCTELTGSTLEEGWLCLPSSTGTPARASWASSVAESQILLVPAGRLNMGWHLLWVCEGLGRVAWEQAGTWPSFGCCCSLSLLRVALLPCCAQCFPKKQLPAEFCSLWFPWQQTLPLGAVSRVSSLLGKLFQTWKALKKGKTPQPTKPSPPAPKPRLGAKKAKFKALRSWREPASLKDTFLIYQKQLWPCSAGECCCSRNWRFL